MSVNFEPRARALAVTLQSSFEVALELWEVQLRENWKENRTRLRRSGNSVYRKDATKRLNVGAGCITLIGQMLQALAFYSEPERIQVESIEAIANRRAAIPEVIDHIFHPTEDAPVELYEIVGNHFKYLHSDFIKFNNSQRRTRA